MSDEFDGLSLERTLGLDVWTVPAMLKARAARSPDTPALRWREGAAENCSWRSMSWGEYRAAAAAVAAGLRRLGLQAGDRVAIMAPSSHRWDLLQQGILAAGGVVVGLEPNDLDENLDTMARRCRLRGLAVADSIWIERFSDRVNARLGFVVQLMGERAAHGLLFDELLRHGEPQPPSIREWVRPNDPATIIFTSGTTGAPKGIQYSHRQFCLAVASIADAFPDIGERSRLVCWLPLANLFQRITSALAIACGAQTYFIEDPRQVMRQVGDIGPDLFVGVPRFYENLYAGIMQQVGEGPCWQRALVAWAQRVGDRHAEALRDRRRPHRVPRLMHGLADRLVLRRLRAVLGPNLRYMVSGSAPMPRWLLERLHAMGLLVLEAYGLSENIIPVAANRPSAYRFGSVGRPMRGCDVRLAEDGELLVRGPGVVHAYYGEAEVELLDSDGYLASGDYAAVDADGFITLTGRKSEVFKTATGRRVAPAEIEGLLLALSSVDQVMVCGAGRPFLVAVLVVAANGLDAELQAGIGQAALLEWCRRHRPRLAAAVAPLPGYKRPAGCVVTARPFSIRDGELTANLKLRRCSVAAHYADQIEALYRLLERAAGAPLLEAVEGQGPDMVLCSL